MIYVVVGIIALPLLFLAFAFFTALCERQYLSGDVEPVSMPYPCPATAYWVETNRQAPPLGFASAGEFATKKNASLVKGLQSLWISSDRKVILSVVSASFAGTTLKKAVLRSRLPDGRIIESTDNPPITDPSRVIQTGVLLNANLPELFHFHWRAIMATGLEPLPFSGPTVLADLEQIDLDRGARLVGMGLARWADPQKTTMRMTLRGAVRHIFRSFFKEAVQLSSQQHRADIPRAGSKAG